MEDKSQRKQFLIDPSFQINFIVKFCVVVVVSSLVIGTVMLFFSKGSTTVAIENTRILAKPTADFVLPVLSGTLLIVTVVSAIAVVVMTLLVSHKIAGPLYRFRKEIDLVKDGDLSAHFNIRRNDQLQSLAQSLREMSEVLREEHHKMNACSERLQVFLDQKGYCISPEDKQEFFELIKELSDSLHFFKA